MLSVWRSDQFLGLSHEWDREMRIEKINDFSRKFIEVTAGWNVNDGEMGGECKYDTFYTYYFSLADPSFRVVWE